MRRLHDALLAVVAATVLAGSFVLTPVGDSLALPDGRPLGATCLASKLTGVSCPGCGLTRSCVALARGDVTRSLTWHPAGTLVLLACATALVAVVGLWATGGAPVWGRPGFVRALHLLAWSTLVLGLLRLLVKGPLP